MVTIEYTNSFPLERCTVAPFDAYSATNPANSPSAPVTMCTVMTVACIDVDSLHP